MKRLSLLLTLAACKAHKPAPTAPPLPARASSSAASASSTPDAGPASAPATSAVAIAPEDGDVDAGKDAPPAEEIEFSLIDREVEVGDFNVKCSDGNCDHHSRHHDVYVSKAGILGIRIAAPPGTRVAIGNQEQVLANGDGEFKIDLPAMLESAQVSMEEWTYGHPYSAITLHLPAWVEPPGTSGVTEAVDLDVSSLAMDALGEGTTTGFLWPNEAAQQQPRNAVVLLMNYPGDNANGYGARTLYDVDLVATLGNPAREIPCGKGQASMEDGDVRVYDRRTGALLTEKVFAPAVPDCSYVPDDPYAPERHNHFNWKEVDDWLAGQVTRGDFDPPPSLGAPPPPGMPTASALRARMIAAGWIPTARPGHTRTGDAIETTLAAANPDGDSLTVSYVDLHKAVSDVSANRAVAVHVAGGDSKAVLAGLDGAATIEDCTRALKQMGWVVGEPEAASPSLPAQGFEARRGDATASVWFCDYHALPPNIALLRDAGHLVFFSTDDQHLSAAVAAGLITP